jgi:hypothetical protein
VRFSMSRVPKCLFLSTPTTIGLPSLPLTSQRELCKGG